MVLFWGCRPLFGRFLLLHLNGVFVAALMRSFPALVRSSPVVLPRSSLCAIPKSKEHSEQSEEKEPSLALKAAWIGTEMIGGVVAAATSPASRKGIPPGAAEAPPGSMVEAASRLRADYDRDYFVTGMIDADIYDEDCLFADPFASFRGRKRFIDNLQNLGQRRLVFISPEAS
jgi:hypothetical protein